MNHTEFTINAIPVAQPRQRHRIVNSGGRSFATNYTPTKHPVNAFKAAVQDAGSKACHSPLTGAVMVWLTFILPRPASKTKKRGDNPRIWKVGKPDIDNLIKSVNDALNGIAWVDDSQVAWINAQKIIAAVDEMPRVIVRICESQQPEGPKNVSHQSEGRRDDSSGERRCDPHHGGSRREVPDSV